MKGLEALQHINKNIIVSQEDIDEDIKIIEKELKALEIIKERKCNVADFITDEPNWEEVLKDYDYWFCELPTKEEYDLLKEVSKW